MRSPNDLFRKLLRHAKACWAAGIPVAVLLLALFSPPEAGAGDGIKTFGDARIGIFASERTARDGRETASEELRLRLRIGAETRMSANWFARGRLAGRFTSEQDRTRWWLRAWAPTRTGLEDGDVTVDEAFLRYTPEHGAWSLRVGRFQTSFELKGVPAKGLDRNDSPNVDITWTDGLHLQHDLNARWRSHLILQGNAARGSGQLARSPLSFDHSASRVTAFAAMEATKPWGPVTQRVFAVTWMPRSLATEGVGAPARDDYFTLTAKIFAEWPLGAGGLRGGFGGEAGYAPKTPLRHLFVPGANGDSDGTAWQLSANLFDFAPGHRIGVVYGRAGAGWLISPDFRNNDRLFEVRHQWRLSKGLSMETRFRRRQEILLSGQAGRARVDDDVYLRFSGRF